MPSASACSDKQDCMFMQEQKVWFPSQETFLAVATV